MEPTVHMGFKDLKTISSRWVQDHIFKNKKIIAARCQCRASMNENFILILILIISFNGTKGKQVCVI